MVAVELSDDDEDESEELVEDFFEAAPVELPLE